jgi:arginine N-succinyltransferase
MQIIRPIRQDDFASLKQIAIESGHGFTSLPVNDDVLSGKIDRAHSSFNKHVEQRGNESYLFVLEDTLSGEVMGTTAINANVGATTPIYHYRQGTHQQRSTRLNLTNTVSTLSICNDYTGSSEICTLFLRENHRKGMAGRLLSRVRFLFMAQNTERFSDTIIAEMRGVSDSEGHSPFWQWLRTHFVDLDFPTIDYMIGIGDTDFISQLMPKHPLYANLLSQQAQDVIGKVHDKTKPALRLLEKEGFTHRGYVDLFDAGPTIESKLSDIKTVKQSEYGPVEIAPAPLDDSTCDAMYAVCNHKVADFRATCTTKVAYDKTTDQITLCPEVASALKVTQGESVRFVKL